MCICKDQEECPQEKREREKEHVRWVRMRMFRREEKAVKRKENGSSVFKNQPHLRAKEPKRERNPPSNSASVSSKQ